MSGPTTRRDRRAERRSQRWPPPDPISPDGRIAGLATTGCVLASALIWLAAGFKVSMCSGLCTARSDVGGLVTLLMALLIAVALGLMRAVLVRPVDEDGASSWRFGLSVLFVIGVVTAASRIGSLNCPPGSHLSTFGYCSGKHDARIVVNSWAWLKYLIDVAAVIVAVTLIGSRRWVRVAAPIAGAVFLFGTTSYLLKTIAA